MPHAAQSRKLRKLITPLALVAFLGATGGLLAGRHGAAAALLDEDAHDLAALKILSRAVVQVQEHYVDPRRIDAKEMIVSALDYVEKSVAEVMVDGSAKSGKLHITVGAKSRDFEISDVDTIWKIPIRLRDIFAFVRDNMVSTQDTREVEYAAVNGMLSTLDPHSVLLKPDVYKEMKLQTKGEFGGLGFVISMRDGQLTVIKVLKGTPAHRGGIKARDQILKIEEESTVNMDLNEAVSRLRGKPGTKVTIAVNRKGWKEPRRFDLQRAQISVETVIAHLLPGSIGYVKVTNFSGSTDRDVLAQLAELKSQNKGTLKGLVLDLRNNPGGLLEQAIKITDLFVDQGTIVTTVGMSDKLREPKGATKRDTDEVALPLAVLVNNNSASASEIVSGALKNLNRAVIIGKQTYGKGSVQVLYELNDPPAEESALKLTIAQYLTPGDISIQEIGVTPDIELLPAKVTKERIAELFAPPKLRREADLEKHFGQGFANPDDEDRPGVKRPPAEKPAEQIRYLAEEPKTAAAKDGETPAPTDEDEDEDLDQEDPDAKFTEDWPTTFARELLTQAPIAERRAMLQASRAFIEEKRKGEAVRVGKAIGDLGIPWDEGQDQGPSKVAAKLEPSGKGVAGETINLVLSAHNVGPAPLYRLRAYTDCENGMFDRKEFVIGTLKPGEKRAWSVPVKIPAHLNARRDTVTVRFQEAFGHAPEQVIAEIDVAELPRPTFAFSAQVVDTEKGNGDGRVDRGESIEVVIEVKNTGAGKAFNVSALIKNLADEKVFIEKGRQKLGEMKPGEAKLARLTLEVKKGYAGATIPLKVTVADEDLGEYLQEKIELKVGGGAPVAVASATGGLKFTQEGEIRASAESGSTALASAKKGAVVLARAKLGDVYRVEWAPGRIGFVTASQVAPTPAKAVNGKFAALYRYEPPRVVLTPDGSRGAPVTDADNFTLSGTVRSSGPVKDVYIFVNEQKVYFKTVGGQQGALDFSADFPLKAGNNTVNVIARTDEDLATQRVLVVHRGKGEVAEVAPKQQRQKSTK